ncbi:unnamed protein product [Brassica oleracea var. botrytis]|uniref:glucan endo-1,3-beta-D-glucosidase n=2 Tax=Brassica oleracea TaxID=3712 RepID=A0A0D3CUC0_BRAOL|nr:unnamed protein product [Brassica oleracea]
MVSRGDKNPQYGTRGFDALARQLGYLIPYSTKWSASRREVGPWGWKSLQQITNYRNRIIPLNFALRLLLPRHSQFRIVSTLPRKQAMKILKCDLLLIVIAVTVVVLMAPPTISAAKVGVTYSTPDFSSGSVEASPKRIVAKIVSMEIEAVRLVDPNPEMIRAFASTKISLFLSVPNPLVPMLASDRLQAFEWVKLHVLPFHNRTKISMISVGDDVVSSSWPDAPPPLFLLRAIRNVRRSLVHLGIHKVSVSTTFSFLSIIPSAFPPSLARFRNPNGDVIIKPILEFLEKTKSSFLVNLYPYNIDSSIHKGFAFFEDPFSYVDDSSIIQVRYGNLFDVMVDAVVRSLAVMGHENLPVVVGETGWPSWSSNSSEVYATPKCSQRFLNALVDHLRAGKGTPLRKEGVSEVYIFELCDNESKQQSKRTWGLLDYHLKK